MKHRVGVLVYLRNRGWTRLEVVVWLFALTFAIVSGILLAAQVVGSWVLPVGGVVVVALGMMRYRVEAKKKRQSAIDQCK